MVLKRDGALAKVYYLDYGNSESLSLGSIFSMPPNQLATQMLSIRCRLIMMTVMMSRIMLVLSWDPWVWVWGLLSACE